MFVAFDDSDHGTRNARRPRLPEAVALAVERAGHLAVWVGLYMGGVAAAIAVLSGLRAEPLALLAAGCTGAGAYLFDRVKLRDSWMDRADRLAHPRRFGYLFRVRHAVRLLAVALGAIGSVCAFILHPALAAVTAGSFVGVVVYAGLPRPMYAAVRTRRPKDILIVKNGAVALSMTVLGVLLVGVPRIGDEGAADVLALPALIVLGHVFVDAMLCDLDDRSADKRFGTATLPVRAGPIATWRVALVMNAALAVGALTLGDPAMLFSALMLASLMVLAVIRPRRVRDLIDLRLPVCAALAMMV